MRGGFRETNVLFLDLEAGYTDIFHLRKLIEQYSYVCTFLTLRYTLILVNLH